MQGEIRRPAVTAFRFRTLVDSRLDFRQIAIKEKTDGTAAAVPGRSGKNRRFIPDNNMEIGARRLVPKAQTSDRKNCGLG